MSVILTNYYVNENLISCDFKRRHMSKPKLQFAFPRMNRKGNHEALSMANKPCPQIPDAFSFPRQVEIYL